MAFVQTNIANLQSGYPGQCQGMAARKRSAINDSGAVRQVTTVTVATAANSTAYTLTLEGRVITVTSAASATVTSIRDQLIAAIRADQQLEGVVLVNPSAAGAFTVSAAIPGVAFTLTESDTNLTTAATQVNVAPVTIPFGRGVVRRRSLQTYSLAITEDDDTAYAFSFAGVTVGFTSDASGTIAEIAEGLGARLRTLLLPGNELAAYAPITQIEETSTALVIRTTADVTVVETDSNLALTTTAVAFEAGAGDDSAELPSAAYQAPLFLGVVERQASNVDPLNADADPAAVSSGQTMTVIYDGDVLVETTGAVRAGDRAYCVHTGAASLGKFSNLPTDAFAVPATFESSTTGAGLALLRLSRAA